MRCMYRKITVIVNNPWASSSIAHYKLKSSFLYYYIINLQILAQIINTSLILLIYNINPRKDHAGKILVRSASYYENIRLVVLRPALPNRRKFRRVRRAHRFTIRQQLLQLHLAGFTAHPAARLPLNHHLLQLAKSLYLFGLLQLYLVYSRTLQAVVYL
jgi:hypothetical protein